MNLLGSAFLAPPTLSAYRVSFPRHQQQLEPGALGALAAGSTPSLAAEFQGEGAWRGSLVLMLPLPAGSLQHIPIPVPSALTDSGVRKTETHASHSPVNKAHTRTGDTHPRHTPKEVHGHTRTRSAQLRAKAWDPLLPAMAPSPPLRVSASP